MTSVLTKVVADASLAWKLLNGVVCLYKPLGWGSRNLIKQFKIKMCNDLNQMKQPPRQERIEIIRIDDNERASRIPLEGEQVLYSFADGSKKIEVVKGLGYSDHPLVTGPRYIPSDIKMLGVCRTGMDVSGVHVYGVNKGVASAARILQSRWINTYLVSGKFGIATDTYFITGRVLQKSTYDFIKKPLFERYLASSESTHQRLAFMASGAPLESEKAYELASQGLVRPDSSSETVIYSMKCAHFKPPDFTIEIKAVNGDPEYLKYLIHEIGLKLKSTATCTKIQCTNIGPFGINNALLFKHWTIDHVLSNMNDSRDILKTFNLNQRDLWVDKPLSEWEPESDDDDKDTDVDTQVLNTKVI